jgi:hypothetical protein
LRLAFLHPEVDLTQSPSSSGEVPFAAEYMALSGGVPPGAAAVWAYGETNRLLDAMDTDARDEGRPSRCGVRQLLVGDP